MISLRSPVDRRDYIVAEAAGVEECQKQIQETEMVIRESLGDLVFGDGEDELQHVVLRCCGEQGKSLAVADVDRKVFFGGLVPRLRTARTAEQTAELAHEARLAFGTDLGLALGEFPATDATGSSPGKIHVAVAGLDGTPTASFPFTGHPEILQPRAVKQTLNFLRLQMHMKRPAE